MKLRNTCVRDSIPVAMLQLSHRLASTTAIFLHRQSLGTGVVVVSCISCISAAVESSLKPADSLVLLTKLLMKPTKSRAKRTTRSRPCFWGCGRAIESEGEQALCPRRVVAPLFPLAFASARRASAQDYHTAAENRAVHAHVVRPSIVAHDSPSLFFHLPCLSAADSLATALSFL